MKYHRITEGIFLARPNRFIAEVEIDGVRCICHVKNTGRCRELLVAGARVILEESDNPARKTPYDLIAVYKGDMLVNIDSQAPNRVFGEWVRAGGCFDYVTVLKPEYTYKNSRFDFYLEANGKQIFVEVKGVTLEQDGVVLFPDAPTERGVKHIRELMDARTNGYEAYLFFVVQMECCHRFMPNRATHSAFAEALAEAEQCGVHIRVVRCRVLPDTLEIVDYIPYQISEAVKA